MSQTDLNKIYESILNDGTFQATAGKSREDSAMDLAKERWTQHTNNERALNMASNDLSKQIKNIYAVATAAAKKAGHKSFKEGEPGKAKLEEIVQALKRTSGISKYQLLAKSFEEQFGIKMYQSLY